MDMPANKAELARQIRSAYASLETLLTQLSESQRIQGGVTEEWSVKNLVAHITFWQTFLERQIRAVLRNEAVPRLDIDSQTDTDRINRQAVTASDQQTWSEVHTTFQDAVQQMLGTIEGLSEDDLFVPGRFQALDRAPLWQCIAGETYEHYATHAEHIRAWVQTTRPI
jgi:hypothetical protein